MVVSMGTSLSENSTENMENLRKKALKMLKRRSPAVEEMSDLEKSHLIEELRIHQVELEMQNEELRAAQEQVIASEKAYRELWEHAPTAYLLVDRAGRISKINSRGRRLLGGTRDEILHKHLITFVHPENSVAAQINLQNTYESGNSEEQEIRMISLEKKTLTCLISSRSARMWPELLQTMIIDITERCTMEQTLRENEERSRLAVEGGRMGTWDWDLVTGAVKWNPRLYELLGLDPDTTAADGELFFSFIHEEDLQRIRSGATAVLRRGSEFNEEFRIVLKNGEIRWLRSSGRVYRDAGGRPVRMAGINLDVTSQKRTEEQLIKTQQELEGRVTERTRQLADSNMQLHRRMEQLARLSTELTLTEERERRRLADFIHDNLQQSLVGAKINLEVLETRIREDQKPSFQNAWDLLLESIRISRTLTSELAQVTAREQGLSTSLQWLAKWMEEKYGLSVELHIDPGVDVFTEDISVLLFQSVRESLMNVKKHAATSSACVLLGRDDDDYLEIVISDNGQGFVAEDAMKCSNGFGLFSIRERLELLGGAMKVRSSPGRGTEIRLTLPCIETVPSVHEETGHVTQTEFSQIAADQKIRVLIVDDHILLRHGLYLLLEEQPDIEITGEAGDGEEAVELAGVLMPHVILMDITMPRMDGIEATRIIHKEMPAIRIIGLSMHDDPHTAEEMLRAGASAYCVKTDNHETLLSAIRSED